MRTSRSIATATVVTVLSLVGCGTGESLSGGPSSPANSPSQPPVSSDGAGSSVPADWQVASVEVAQLQAPPDWTLDSNRDLSQRLSAPKGSIGISPGSGGIQADVYSADGDVTAALDELAGLRGKSLKKDSSFTTLEKLPNETINGSLFYHFRAETEYTWEDHYGTLVPGAGMQVTVVWSFNKSDIDRKGAEALSKPIMATYEVL